MHGGRMTRALLLQLTSVSIVIVLASAGDTLTASQPLKDGQKIVSASCKFELGFFAFNGSSHRYVGIWYHNMPESPVVWLANRENPVTTFGGVLKVAEDGNMDIVDESGHVVWGTNMSVVRVTAVTPVAQLLDSGNLILRDPDNAGRGEGGKPIWQSFDHPTDTLLPGMNLGWFAGASRFITSRKSMHDPTPGRFRYEMDEGHGGQEIILWNRDSPSFRTGAWLGTDFSGMPYISSSVVNFTVRATKGELTFSFHLLDQTVPTRLVLNSVGLVQQLAYIGTPKEWHVYAYSPQDRCDTYGECGPYSTCDPIARPICACVHGFRPRDDKAWQLGVGTEGCVRLTRFHCTNVGFVTLTSVKLPQAPRAFVDRGMSLEMCEALCRRNCSCTAYSNSDISGAVRSGCMVWFGDLIDIKRFENGGLDLYVKVAASDIDIEIPPDDKSGGSSRKLKISLAAGAGSFALLICLALALWKRKQVLNMCKATSGQKGPLERSQDYLLTKVGLSSKRDISDDSKSQEFELPLFDLNAVSLATNNFSEANKLGQGGFGTVYKGMLMEGQEIAVKRLSQTSGQGIEEFKNEVRLIARLQHRNLVRLVGCCVEMEEKILIYEFMPNNSLDSFIFDTAKNSVLNWRRRFGIICGIARGLLYLHQDSRYRVIHRDLKASNILLDAQMIPKISDFGMARIFGGDQLEANTCRVVGTYGYMSPEYAMDGHFSVKSDVFSFGVLVLEIITGKKNRGFYYSNTEHNLLGYAWSLWQEGKGVELIDPSVGASYSVNEVLRCLQVGLVCVQERAEDRPTMATVVLMLSSENTVLPEPRHPGFCMGRNPLETSTSSSKRDESSHTINQVTVSVIDPR